MKFRVLGPIELWVAGDEQDLGTVKERHILTVLLLAQGRPVSVETLIDHVWGEDPPTRDTLYTHIARLRGKLRRISGDNLLKSRSGSYTLQIDRDAVDLHRFRSLVAEARAMTESGEDQQAIAKFRTAEALWNGEALAGLIGDWARNTRHKLNAERLDATLDRIAAQLRLGRHAGLVAELSDLVSVHPLNETVVECTMLALYQSGRQSDALQAYRNVHRRLDDELGIEPSSRLQELHQRMLARDPTLTVSAASAGNHRDTVDPAPNTLPRDIPSFAGRAKELGTILDFIASNTGTAVTIFTISGMAGVGKTALAVHAAHRLVEHFPDCQLYVDLHAHDSEREPIRPADALETLLRFVGVPADQVPATLDERAAMWRTRMARRHALILLDDASGRDQVQPLLPGSPGCLVLITSRRRLLGLRGAQAIPLDVLPKHDAQRLFTSIIGSRRADEVEAIGDVVELCGLLPLAVEIAASRLSHRPVWSVADLAIRLTRTKHRLAELHVEDLHVGSAFELSYRELSSAQQQAFRSLGLHVGSQITSDATAALIGCSRPDTERILDDLVEFHLLEEPHPGRFRLHDLLREYARDLAIHDDPEPRRRMRISRLLDYYLHTADEADRLLHPHRRRRDVAITYPPSATPSLDGVDEARAWIQTEFPNLLASIKYAADHQCPEHTAQLSHVLADILDATGRWREAVAVHSHAVDAWRNIGDRHGEAQALGSLSRMQYRCGRYDAALDHAGKALATYRDVGDQRGEADMLDQIGLVYWHTAQYLESLAFFQEALAIQRDIGDRHGEIDSISHSGFIYWHIGRYQEAVRNFEEALSICRSIGDRRREAKNLNNIGDVRQHLGYHRDALELYQQALTMFEENGDSQYVAIVHNNIGNVYRYKGLYDEALEYQRRALVIYRDTDDVRNQADSLNNIGQTYHSAERYAEAIIHHQMALSIAQEIVESYEQVRSHLGLGEGYRETARYAAALDHYQTAMGMARQLGTPYEEARSLNGIGETLLHLRGQAAAKAYWQQALGLFQQLGVPEVEAVRIRLQTLGAAG